MPTTSNTQHPIPNPPRPRWVYIFALLVMVVTTIPYFVGYAAQGTEWRFTGFVFGVEDGNSYIAKMLGGATGDWLFRTPYSAVPQRGVIAFLPYLLLGKLTAPPAQHVQLVALFHLFRFGAGILAIIASYDFIALFVVRRYLRCWGVVLASLGGGLGWVLVLLGKASWPAWMPLEYYSPESFGFLAIYGLPHLALSRALLLWGLRAYLVSENHWDSVKIGGLWLVMGLAQPLNVVIAWAVIGAHLLFFCLVQFIQYLRGIEPQWNIWKTFLGRALVVGAISAPIVFYSILTFSTDPVLRAWKAHSYVISPQPLMYLLAYGLLIPFGILGAFKLSKQNFFQGWLLIGWILILPGLLYAPFNFQRRLAEGVWVALVVLALKALENLPEGSKPKWSWAWVLAFPSTFILLMGGIIVARTPTQPIFRPTAEITAFQHLAQNAAPNAVVLSSQKTGNPLPAWTPLQVVIGHGPETIHTEELYPRIQAFYQVDTLSKERRVLLDEYQVNYVFYGPAERELGSWNPAQAEYLTPIYQSGDYTIFSVER